jgi:quinol monooxygenase YgiN
MPKPQEIPMFELDTCCTLVPYFEVQADKLDAFKALGKQFVTRTRTESGCMHYAFSFSGNTAHCREGYDNAASLLAHLENVGDLLDEALKIAQLVRLEVHGPAPEVDKLREPLAALAPQFFVLEEGIRRAGKA